MGDILFLAHRIPFPPDRGDKMRSFHLIQALARLGRVHLASFADDEADLAHAEALRPLVAQMHVERRSRSPIAAGLRALVQRRPISLTLFDSPALRDFVARLLVEEPIDRIFAFSGQMAQFVPDSRQERRILMDFVDVDSAKFEALAARARGPMQWVYAREAERLSAFERQAAAKADLSLLVSDAEAELFRQSTGLGRDRVVALENGVDLAFYAPTAAFAPVAAGPDPLIVFTGQMDYRPNIEAVTSFAKYSLPAVLARHPAARLAIVGRNPDAAVRRLAGRHVIVTGAVPDVRGWLAAADVAVAPLRLARGIQNKILEAMAMARPVVASPAAFEGLDAVPGRDLVVADAASEAEAVATLLDDPLAARRLGANARARVEARYSWDVRLASLVSLLRPGPDRMIEAAA